MDSVSSAPVPPLTPKGRRQLYVALRDSLRAMSVQLSVLNHQVGSHLGIKGSDLECFALIEAHQPMTPSELARRTGLHPATMTGILDRLERGGWITRARDTADRRGVFLRPLGTRIGDVTRLYSGMTTAMEEICADYDEDELTRVLGFLRRVAEAGHGAASELADRPRPSSPG